MGKRRPNRKCRNVDVAVKLMKNKTAIKLFLKNIMSVAVFMCSLYSTWKPSLVIGNWEELN
jgi:hypothetical protein